jgi:hypothetical protein
MPTISTFFGIVIRINFDDHNPPHFHAEYQGHSATFTINNGEILAGRFPEALKGTIRNWTLKHQSEIMQNWTNAVAKRPLFKVPGADND